MGCVPVPDAELFLGLLDVLRLELGNVDAIMIGDKGRITRLRHAGDKRQSNE